eukprot:CAMPEP_0197631476 /NCGR_PEP_ID=MMETSP1338-20131121/8624_1 /TAXON_ID=43686 ORGANISM="Pelagodinium beii, Strain RCC1491" /NCGR_SAMPLE_ID=MMETSP1338 /ASSEMBLY_ACC=CAM_ASM_000754 /LENGTH=173 /DNA_ID=CAMNT_0043202929 /DNA_START=81 /DNA_END=602 /DNA_ORIENTATION=+
MFASEAASEARFDLAFDNKTDLSFQCSHCKFDIAEGKRMHLHVGRCFCSKACRRRGRPASWRAISPSSSDDERSGSLGLRRSKSSSRDVSCASNVGQEAQEITEPRVSWMTSFTLLLLHEAIDLAKRLRKICLVLLATQADEKDFCLGEKKNKRSLSEASTEPGGEETEESNL